MSESDLSPQGQPPTSRDAEIKEQSAQPQTSEQPSSDLQAEIFSGPGDPPSSYSPNDFPNVAAPAKAGAATLTQAERGTVRAIHYRLSYLVRHPERGPRGAIVLLHDLPGGAFSWDDVLPRLDTAGRAVYAFDMLGYGQSEYPWPSDTSVWGHADSLALAFQRLNFEDIVLVGVGVGATVAEILATRMYRTGIAKLVLINAYGYEYAFAPNWPLPEMEKRHDPEAPKHTPLDAMLADLRATLPQASAKPTFLKGSRLDAYVDAWKTEVGKEMLFQHIRLMIPNYTNSVASDLKKLQIPVLIIWSASDNVTPVALGQRLAREIPGSRLETIPDAGHLVLDDAPDTVASLLADFAGSR